MKKKFKNNIEQNLIAIIVVVTIVVLLTFQGGFYYNITCALSLVCSIIFIAFSIILKKIKFSLSAVTFFLIGIFYLISMYINGVVITSILATSKIFSIVSFALLISLLNGYGRNITIKILAIVGVISSVFGILMYLGLISVNGAIDGQRLAFTFQYANTAGL